MKLALRKRILPSASAFCPSLPPPAEHHWRSGGLGDFVFMEPALRKLKAQDPTRRLVLHAPEKYRAIHKLIGFDDFEGNETGVCMGEGLDLHWTLERHPGWYCLDRVSIWEDILEVPVGDEAVQLDVVRSPELLPIPKGDKPTLCFLPFASNAGTAGRSLPMDHIVTLSKALSHSYEVVLPVGFPPCEDLRSSRAHLIGPLDLQNFMPLVASCDKCLGVDSGGIYVAAAAGVPTVGLYSHVDPWLRIRRFPLLYGLDLRDPTCQCEQHGTCSRPVRNECPCKYVAPEVVLYALGTDGGQCYSPSREGYILRPRVTAVRDDGKPTTRTQDFNLDHIFSGLVARFGENPRADFTLTLRGDELIPRHVFLRALSDLRQPGYNQKPCPIDLKRTRP